MTSAEVVAIALAAISAFVSLTTVFAQMRSQREIAGLSSQLRAQKDTQRLLFSSLHTKRIEVLTDLYASLAEMHMAHDLYPEHLRADGTPVQVELMDLAREKAAAFVFFYQKNRIWLGQDICTSVDQLIQVFANATTIYAGLQLAEPSTDSRAHFIRIRTYIQRNVPTIRIKIDAQFRTMLGEVATDEALQIEGKPATLR
jgi:hypothetical protein